MFARATFYTVTQSVTLSLSLVLLIVSLVPLIVSLVPLIVSLVLLIVSLVLLIVSLVPLIVCDVACSQRRLLFVCLSLMPSTKSRNLAGDIS